MIRPGLLIVLSGPSGVGKDTVLYKLLASREDCVLSLSATTRAPRPGETEGIEYHFVTHEQFDEMVEAGEMLEHATYSGNHYGTPVGPVAAQRAAGKHVILEIEVQGANQIRKKCPDAVFIFIMPPDMSSLYRRLSSRGTENAADIEARMHAAKAEISLAQRYDYIVVNEDVETSAAQLSAVITAADCHVDRMTDIIMEVCDNA